MDDAARELIGRLATEALFEALFLAASAQTAEDRAYAAAQWQAATKILIAIGANPETFKDGDRLMNAGGDRCLTC